MSDTKNDEAKQTAWEAGYEAGWKAGRKQFKKDYLKMLEKSHKKHALTLMGYDDENDKEKT